MTSQPPQPGWYPQPGGKPGQMYWDGRQWHKNTLTTPPPAGPAPGDAVGPHADTDRGLWRKARRLWSGLPRQRQIVLAVAVLLVVLAAVAAPIIAFSGGRMSDKSPSYQAGYTSGSSGTAHIAAFGLGIDFACKASFSKAQLANPSFVAGDYIQGCLDGFRDHPKS